MHQNCAILLKKKNSAHLPTAHRYGFFFFFLSAFKSLIEEHPQPAQKVQRGHLLAVHLVERRNADDGGGDGGEDNATGDDGEEGVLEGGGDGGLGDEGVGEGGGGAHGHGGGELLSLGAVRTKVGRYKEERSVF